MQAQERLTTYGHNSLSKKSGQSGIILFLNQFRSPIILILICASIVSAALQDFADTAIILAIIIASGALSFFQEYHAGNTVAKLLRTVKTKTTLMRDALQKEVFVDEVVPGDIIILSAGSIIPADCRLLESRDFFVNEAILTGETFPVEKSASAEPQGHTLAQRKNTLFMGTSVESGLAVAVAVKTGSSTELGHIAGRLVHAPPETDFERGVRRFGYLLMEVTLVLVLIVFAVNVYFHKAVIESLLFSLALAVGLTPQLLPAIISINLAKGSQVMARRGVIVKRLTAIENFGTMDVLCTDKTGTLTEGAVFLHDYLNADGEKDPKLLSYAHLNAALQTGLRNPIDAAITAYATEDLSPYEKVDEIPYDFIRRRLSVVVKSHDGCTMITKGALKSMLTICTHVECNGVSRAISKERAAIERLHHAWSEKGLRILALAYKQLPETAACTRADESGMTLLGFLLFLDPPKADAKEMVASLQALGVHIKVITGDNRYIARYTAESVGFPVQGVITGDDLVTMSDEALVHAADANNIFAEVDPNQKEKIIRALKKGGRVVGFMGDGINDAAAIHAADVGISVNTAVDVAKEAADIVLLEKNLSTLKAGVLEGRKTFANTMKYVFMATSANFGNMFSVAGSSLFLAFLPMLPKQILLTNLLTDVSEMTIATDNVDPEQLENPRRWDIAFIKRFMLFFGLMSSVFDYLTFGVLLYVLNADPVLFRTGWFIESVLSASLVVLIIRTRKPFFQSRPGKHLAITTVAIAGITLSIPFSPFAGVLGLQPVSIGFLCALAGILVLYGIFAEIGKAVFYRKFAG
ncbi:MAG: Mg2+-importing ATPase [Nitrospirae bacterium]|nr:MAG: Mg2+-importing ATPase [Nitrospirota bacterium]